MYTYLQSDSACWTVGCYNPDGKWQAESDHSTLAAAAERVAYLNGGGAPLQRVERLQQQMKELEAIVYENAALRQHLSEIEAVVVKLEGVDASADRSKRPYELSVVNTATCPRCGSVGPLALAPAGAIVRVGALPAFLICASCLYIGQIGVGVVPRIGETPGID